jgi:hypothetical protein
MKQHSKEPNRLLEQSTAAEAGAPSAADGDSNLGGQIRQRYGSSPGVIPMGATLGLAARFTRLSTDRLPLLAQIQRRWAPADGGSPRSWSGLPYAWPYERTRVLSPKPEAVQRAVGKHSEKSKTGSSDGAGARQQAAAESPGRKEKLGEHILKRYGASPGVVSTDKKPGVVGRVSRLSGGRSSLAAEIQRRWVPPGFSAARPLTVFHSASAAQATDVQSPAQALPAVQMSKSTRTVGQGSPILGHTIVQGAETSKQTRTGIKGSPIPEHTIVQRSYHGPSEGTLPGVEAWPVSDAVTGAGTVMIRSKATLPEPGTTVQRAAQARAARALAPADDEPQVGSVQGHDSVSAGYAGRNASVLPMATTTRAGMPTLQRELYFSASGNGMLRRAIDTGVSSGPASLEMPLAQPSVESGVRAGIGNSRVMQAQRVNGSHPDPPAIASASSAHTALLQTYPDKTKMRQTSRHNNNLQVSEMTSGTSAVEPDVGSEERMDVEELVDKVMRKFLRRLQIEGERGGRQPWPWRS